MTENKRFTYGANERWEDVLIDNLEKKEYSLHFIDELCNRLWEQTKRFEKHNKDLSDENDRLKREIKDLRKSVLNSLHEVDGIQCTCSPCVVEECVKKVI